MHGKGSLRVHFACASALVIAACGVPQPINDEVDAPDGADDAAAMIVAEWAARLPNAGWLSPDDLPTIRWFAPLPSDAPCSALDYDDGETPCAAGGYSTAPFADPEIHLLLITPLHNSRLSHETLHWALDVTAGDKDHDHERREIWAQVAGVRSLLSDAGM
jgi:hypothetical protein